MFEDVNTRFPTEVELAVGRIFRDMFPTADRMLVQRAFDWAIACFEGKYKNYLPIDAKYHDLEHTLQGTLCLSRIMHGWHLNHGQPEITLRKFELALLAILLHDTGYLKTDDDPEGTGAKYTLIHVRRSAEFAGVLLKEKGFLPNEILTVQNMIQCTGVNVDIKAIPFQNELERRLGYALGSADLLGQMAAEDYVDKLPILYLEFEESARFNSGKGSGVGTFSSAIDLLRKTPTFWEKYVLPKIDNDFLGLYRFLCDPYPHGPNYYLEKIHKNLHRLKSHLAELPPG
jgi:hypothetical protein